MNAQTSVGCDFFTYIYENIHSTELHVKYFTLSAQRDVQLIKCCIVPWTLFHLTMHHLLYYTTFTLHHLWAKYSVELDSSQAIYGRINLTDIYIYIYISIKVTRVIREKVNLKVVFKPGRNALRRLWKRGFFSFQRFENVLCIYRLGMCRFWYLNVVSWANVKVYFSSFRVRITTILTVV